MTRRVRITQACLAGVALGSLIAGALPPRSYNKDLQQQYLSGRALRDGIDSSRQSATSRRATSRPRPTPSLTRPRTPRRWRS